MGLIEADTVLIVGIILALGAGALSFLSPCVLPIFPAFLSYITGISVKELHENKTAEVRKKLLFHSFFFILGISVVFISLGIGASFLGQWIQKMLTGTTGVLIQRLAGIFIIIMGLFVAGWIQIPALMKDSRRQFSNKPVGYLGTLFVGIGFAAGWTPCIGPIFGSILFLAASQPAHGMIYTLMYVIGFSLPFILLTFFLGSSKWIVRHGQVIMKVGGMVMIIMGLVLFTGQMPRIAKFFLQLVENTWFEKLG